MRVLSRSPSLSLSLSLSLASLARSQVDIRIRVKGGGYTSQIYAIRQAIAKSIVAFYQKFVDEESKNGVKNLLLSYDRSLLVADPRRCEPKKFGGPSARSRYQKSYRECWGSCCCCGRLRGTSLTLLVLPLLAAARLNEVRARTRRKRWSSSCARAAWVLRQRGAAVVGASSPSSLAADLQLGHKLDGRGLCAHVRVDNVWREVAYLGESVKLKDFGLVRARQHDTKQPSGKARFAERRGLATRRSVPDDVRRWGSERLRPHHTNMKKCREANRNGLAQLPFLIDRRQPFAALRSLRAFVVLAAPARACSRAATPARAHPQPADQIGLVLSPQRQLALSRPAAPAQTRSRDAASRRWRSRPGRGFSSGSFSARGPTSARSWPAAAARAWSRGERQALIGVRDGAGKLKCVLVERPATLTGSSASCGARRRPAFVFSGWDAARSARRRSVPPWRAAPPPGLLLACLASALTHQCQRLGGWSFFSCRS